MNNTQIIINAMIEKGLDPEQTTIDTYSGWKRKNYKVRKGEQAIFTKRIWRPKPFSNKEKFALVDASFYTDKQVELVNENGK